MKKKKLTDKMITDAIKQLDNINVPTKERTFIVYVDTPEKEQMYAELVGWA